jgi:Quinohemoprotein amine dehydrogenase, alpha subunit domain III
MTDAYTKSSVYVRSDVETASITVTPILYLSNGVKLTLSAITLKPAGTAVININDGLAAQGIAPYATLSGYIELQYSWPWDALCATVSSVDATHSVIFTFGLNPPAASHVGGQGAQAPASPTTGPQVLEGTWWKEEAGVTGFVALSNTTEQALPATVQVSDANANPLGTYTLTVSPHGTKRVDLQELAPVTSSLGGLRVTFNGTPDALIVNGSLEDLSKGYSAGMPFGMSPATSAKSATVSYAELGLMTGAADPMMHFPVGTVFKPYSVVRNLGAQPISVTPVLYWMQGGAALTSRLAAFTISPLQTKSLDVLSLLGLSGMKDFNGAVNLVLEVQGPAGSALLASGSVDQSNTYVFEVVPRGVSESASKNLSYWSTANGDDTMVTLWNAADEAQVLVFTVFFSGGHYLFPVHLEPRATQTFNISEVIQNQIPDSQGNVIPLSVQEGSAKLSGPQGENEHILVAMDAGTYNVRKATCAWRCINCNGAVSWAILANPFAVAMNGSTQLSFTSTWNTGSTYNRTGASTWGSSNTGVATVNTGLVSGVGVGNVIVNGVDNSEPWAGQVCGSIPVCPPDQGIDGSAPGTTRPRIDSINPAQGSIGTTVPVTISGRGFGTSPTVQTSTGIAVTVAQSSDTTINASFAIAPNAAVGSYGVTVSVTAPDSSTVTSNSVNFNVTPHIDSISPSRGLIGATTSQVTINGKGFTGGHVDTPSAIQVSNETTFTDTQIVLDLVVSGTASLGNNSISVSVSGGSSNAVNFFIQEPTSLSIVAGTATGTEGACAANACGTAISFKYQVMDQDKPAQPIHAVMSFWDSFSAYSPDNLHLGSVTQTTCSPVNTGPCAGALTPSDGTFLEGYLGACCTICVVNGACGTGGPSVASQTWHIAGYAIVQQVSIYCEKVLVNGVQPQ